MGTKQSDQIMNDTKKQDIPIEGQPKGQSFKDGDELLKELDACRLSVKEWQEKYVRLGADLENFKRRISKEQQRWADMAKADLIIQLLTIVDNFDRAMEHKDLEFPEEIQSWVDGISMIHSAVKAFLTKADVKEVSYDIFDPSYHEALLHVDSDEHESGQIVEVMEKGYMLNDSVLRHAKVSVAK